MKTKIYWILILFFLAGCESKEEKLKNEIVNALKENNGNVKLSELNSLDWNKMYIVGPSYGRPKGSYDSTLIKHTKLFDKLGISSRDDICLYMFFKNDSLLGQTQISTGQIGLELPVTAPIRNYKPNQSLKYVQDPKYKGFILKEIK